MRRMLYLALALALLAGMWVPTTAYAGEREPTVDVIIQVDGSTAALAQHIEALGGRIRFKYRNVPAVAASIPASKLAQVAGFAGVTKIEKDRLVYLHDGLAGGKNEDRPLSYVVQDLAGVEVQAVDPAAIDPGAFPEGYANFLYTGAASTWSLTGAGEGSVVAVVDTGTVPNVCLSHAVIGAPGYPDGFNATGDGIPATDPANHWHGTHVGGVIASACALSFSNPDDPLYRAISAYLPWPPDFVPIYGQAPLAQLYPVKVFPADGSGTPTSVILAGLDHILTLKKEGLLDIDVVNMSLGGPTVADGLDVFDRFIAELAKASILVVTSAGNEGPKPNSVGSPATSFFSISTGALDYAPSSRVLYEFLGYRYDLGPGQGLVMRPSDEVRVANFSSRGPLSDGRGGPDISALGLWNFQAGPNNELRWAGGTSFSSPTVAGGAALLNAYWEAQGRETNPLVLASVLLRGADPDQVGPAWRAFNDQGYGALDVPAALDLLTSGDWRPPRPKRTGQLEANVLPKARRGQVDTWESSTITLNPSEKFDAVFEISEYTSKVTVEIYDVVAPDNSAYAFWPNALEVHLQSAKRTAFQDPVAVYWYPFWYGDSFDIVVEDGPWTFWGIPWDYQPMEPGLMKLTLAGDYSNEAPVSFKVRITRENLRQPLSDPVAMGKIKMGESAVIPVEIPAGAATATFDLDWLFKWDKFPTSDIDMFIFDPGFNLVSTAGVSGNAPERAVISGPAPGTWWVYIDGYELYTPDLYRLFVTIE